MVNIVKFAQFYCIYLLSSNTNVVFTKKCMVVPLSIQKSIFGGLQAGISCIIFMFFEIISCKISSEGIISFT